MKVWLSIFAGTFIAATLAAASPLSAREPGGDAPPAAKPSTDPDKLICRRQVVVGSRLPGPKVCRTKAQWEGNNRNDQDAVRTMQQDRSNLPN